MIQETKIETPEVKYEVVKNWGDPQVQEHAAKVGGLRLLKEVEVTTDDGYKFCYLIKRPNRHIVNAIASKKKAGDVDTEAVTNLMLGLVLEGDRQTLENDAAVSSELIKQIGGLVNSATSEIKKI